MKSMLALLLFAIVAVPSYSFGGVESDAGLFRSLFSSTAPQNVKDAENFQAALIQNYILSYDDFKKVLLRRDVLKNDGKIYEFVSAKGEKRITTIGYDYLAIEMGYTNAVDEQIKIFSPQIRDSKLVNEIRPMVNLALKYLTEALRAKVNNENEIELQLYQIRLAKMAKELTIQIDRSGLGYYASFDSNENILKISPAVILKLPPAAQIFVLAHEFGHTLDFFDILMAIDGDGEFIAEEQDLLELLPFKEDKALKNYYVKSIVPVKLKIEKLVKELKNSQRVVQLNIKPEMLDPINKVINGEIPYAQRVAFGIYI
ncbi:MAG: hypothetical protein J6Y94_02570, partial [Bacteriovoracaceae bacterium]|nr:hypothetical protein [Bacteriovoracaceae bacterium]